MTSWEHDSDDLLRSVESRSDDILGRVDEYTLYCHYLGYEPIPNSGKYRSPIRTGEKFDDDPSFGIFYSTKHPNREFLWKDQATGQVGDIFKLIKLMFRYTSTRQAENRVIHDFGLGNVDVVLRDPLVLHKPPPRTDIDIKIVSRCFLEKEIEYWKRYNVTQELLSMYQVSAVAMYWLAKEQTVPYTPREYCFAYRIWKQYKVYQPFAEKHLKFRNNFTDQHIEGLLQLKFNSPLLVITKATKDVMFFRSIGIEAIAPRSENTPILPQHIEALGKKYPRMVTFFDNDGKCRRDFYDMPHHEVPKDSGEKDPTDFCFRFGVQRAKEMVMAQLQQYL